ncbi:electron transport complex subunit RsxG [Alteromonas genovensis]|uniref:electron transport complex subunit RsxG n=1 Tax=Alteromonas genovensis TaxID=471225 RepID=UPI002FE127F7
MSKGSFFKNNPIKDSLIKNGAMLGAFAIVTTALIAVTFFGTKDTIEEQKRRKLLSVLNEVVPSSLHTNPLYADCTVIDSSALGPGNHAIYRARLNGQPSGLVVQATAPDGYSGNIDMVIGVDVNLNVLGVRVVEHKETPGLGDKVELAVSDWIKTFAGKDFSSNNLAPWQVKKDGGEFDQFTGATITPRAVVNAVKNALIYVEENQTRLFDAPNQCQIGSDINADSQEQPS